MTTEEMNITMARDNILETDDKMRFSAPTGKERRERKEDGENNNNNNKKKVRKRAKKEGTMTIDLAQARQISPFSFYFILFFFHF